MADGMFPSLVSKDRAVNAVTNPIYTQLVDGTNAISVTGTSLDVNITGGGGGSQYAVDAVAGGADLGNLALVVRDDALTTLTPADGDYAQMRVDSTGRLWCNVSNTVTVTPSGTVNVDIQDAWSAETGGGAEANALRVTIANDSTGLLSVDDNGASLTIDNSTLAVVGGGAEATALRVTIANDSTGVLSIDDNGGSITVDASDLDIRNLNLTDDAVKISGNASANSITNPIFVQNVKTAVQAQEIHDYLDGTSSGETANNHDYTVAGTTFLLTSVIAACSGAMKFEIQTGPLASLVTKAVGFLTGRQGDTKQVFFDPPIEVPSTSTGTVRVIRTSRNGTGVNVDLYSTIIGNDVA